MEMSWELQYMVFRFGCKSLTRDFVNAFLQWLHSHVEMLLQIQTITVFPGNQQIAYTLGEEIWANFSLKREIMEFNFIIKILDFH